jgi:hypothetical protein
MFTLEVPFAKIAKIKGTRKLRGLQYTVNLKIKYPSVNVNDRPPGTGGLTDIIEKTFPSSTQECHLHVTIGDKKIWTVSCPGVIYIYSKVTYVEIDIKYISCTDFREYNYSYLYNTAFL